MSKLLCNVLKFSAGGTNAPNAPPGCAPDTDLKNVAFGKQHIACTDKLEGRSFYLAFRTVH